MTRVVAACGVASAFARPSRSEAPAGQVRRIGLALGEDPEGGAAAFREALRRLGHVEGQNLQIETREAGRMPPGVNAAAELARMDLELVVVHALPFAIAARDANPDMPLVIVTTPGIVVNGFAKSLERPGGNATGIDELPPGVTGRRLELLKKAAPRVARIALLSTTPGRGGHEIQLTDAQEAANRLGVTVKSYRVKTIDEFAGAFSSIVADGMDGLLNFQGGLSFMNRQLIVDFAAQHRLPAIYQATVFARAGGLMCWAPDLVQQFRDAAGYVDAILRGAKPGDLPIKHPAQYFLTLNLAAARGLDLNFPPELVSSADTVIQ